MFSKAAVNTFLFTVASIAGQFVIGLALAIYFYRKFPLSGVLRSLLLLPWLIPLIAAQRRVALDPRRGQRRAELGADRASRSSTPAPGG